MKADTSTANDTSFTTSSYHRKRCRRLCCGNDCTGCTTSTSAITSPAIVTSIPQHHYQHNHQHHHQHHHKHKHKQVSITAAYTSTSTSTSSLQSSSPLSFESLPSEVLLQIRGGQGQEKRKERQGQRQRLHRLNRLNRLHKLRQGQGQRQRQRQRLELPLQFLLFLVTAMTVTLHYKHDYVHSFVLQQHLQRQRQPMPLLLSNLQPRSRSISTTLSRSRNRNRNQNQNQKYNDMNICNKRSYTSMVSLAAASSRATGTDGQGLGQEQGDGQGNGRGMETKQNNDYDSMRNDQTNMNNVANHKNNNSDNNNNSNTDGNHEEITLMEVDVRHDARTVLSYDPIIERYVEYNPQQKNGANGSGRGTKNDSNNVESTSALRSISRSRSATAPILLQKVQRKLNKAFTNAFLPEGVTDSYYRYMKWRFLQRFINANVHVFGTQSLLMGLGIQNKQRSAAAAASSSTAAASALGLSAVFNWVLKDALGKIVRMVWASRMGRKFDPDAKRWRYRSSLLFALGNGLEVMTYVYPSFFLLLATMANACKQMSMLTSSATRNALYNSFRDGTRENIGDITAKGEAQIAIVDLFGIISGVCLSRAIGTSVKSVLSVWVLLQIFEVFCVYKEIRSVVFRMLNFERLWIVVNKFIHIFNERDLINGSAKDIPLPTPDMIADDEKIFMPPNHLARRAISFGSLSRAKLSPEELSELIKVFQNEKYILVVGQDLKNKRIKWNWFNGGTNKNRDGNVEGSDTLSISEQLKIDVQENCHIVLHADANNADIVKSTLALAILRRKLADAVPSDEFFNSMNPDNQSNSIIGQINGDIDRFNEKTVAELIKTQRSRDCMNLIQESRSEVDQLFGPFLKVLLARGWATPARFMFGRVSMRTEWPIMKR